MLQVHVHIIGRGFGNYEVYTIRPRSLVRGLLWWPTGGSEFSNRSRNSFELNAVLSSVPNPPILANKTIDSVIVGAELNNQIAPLPLGLILERSNGTASGDGRYVSRLGV